MTADRLMEQVSTYVEEKIGFSANAESALICNILTYIAKNAEDEEDAEFLLGHFFTTDYIDLLTEDDRKKIASLLVKC